MSHCAGFGMVSNSKELEAIRIASEYRYFIGFVCPECNRNGVNLRAPESIRILRDQRCYGCMHRLVLRSCWKDPKREKVEVATMSENEMNEDKLQNMVTMANLGDKLLLFRCECGKCSAQTADIDILKAFVFDCDMKCPGCGSEKKFVGFQ